MDSALLIHRLHFAFTVTFHYLFPQLTMGARAFDCGAEDTRAAAER
jgi:cytochrome bd-type quinol oxidase subunit 1